MPRLPFLPSAYGQGRSTAFESQRFINLYPELATAPGAKNIAALVGTPGLRLWYYNPSAPVRGAVVFGGRCYVVLSNELVSIATDGVTVTTHGTLQTSTGRVIMKNNGVTADGVGGNQLCIVDGAARYIYDILAGTFTTYTDILTPLGLEYIDGYFVFTNGSMSFWTSNLYDGAAVNPLTQNPVQAASDSIQAVLNIHQQLFFVKQYTTEVYYDAGTPTSSGSPFSRIDGSVIDYGTCAPASAVRGDGSAFFLANKRGDEGGSFVGVVMLNGYTPTVITPPSVTYRMSLSTDLTRCFGYVYYDEGHTFYVLTNPVDDWTFVYDTTTQMWHERSTTSQIDGRVHRHLGNCYVNFNSMHLVGDSVGGSLYEMSSEFYTDAGLPIIGEQTTQHLADEDYLEDVFIGELKVDVEAGVGLAGVNSPATATCAVSGGAVVSCTVGYNGADYTVAPAVILRSTDITGSGATAEAVVLKGSIQAVNITSGGSGYTRPPEVIFAMPEVIPTVGLSISKDGGKTWGNEYVKSMGRAGEYRKRLIWRSLGRSKDRVFRLRISSPVKKIIMGYYLEVS